MLEAVSVVPWTSAMEWGAVEVELRVVKVGDRDHVGAGEQVQVTPHPERWGQGGNLLTLVQGQVGAVELVGAEGLLGCGEDPRPR